VWADALDLRIEIDDTVKGWEPGGASTPAGLRQLTGRRYRPQDTRTLEEIAGTVESWAVAIRSLLDPQRVKHVSAPCPACGATHVYRRDSAGERVRVPALQIVVETGCTCQACRHTWAPQHYPAAVPECSASTNTRVSAIKPVTGPPPEARVTGDGAPQ
jgi:acetyl esterase/lipase